MNMWNFLYLLIGDVNKVHSTEKYLRTVGRDNNAWRWRFRKKRIKPIVKDDKIIVRIKLWIQRNGYGLAEKGLNIVCVCVTGKMRIQIIHFKCIVLHWLQFMHIIFSHLFKKIFINVDYLLVWVCLLIFLNVFCFILSSLPTPPLYLYLCIFIVFMFVFSLWSFHPYI